MNKAAVLLSPEDDPSYLAVFKSATSVQLVPSHVSVAALLGGVSPPKIMPDVDVPVPLCAYLSVFILLTSVQDVPS